MTDAEISRRLAIAIGYKEHDLHNGTFDGLLRARFNGEWWSVFDYRDPAVIWPIAERFKCFPDYCKDISGNWSAWCDPIRDFVYASTAAKAVARAVIKAHEAKK